MRIHKCIDDALHLQVTRFIINTGLSYVDTSGCYNHPYKFIRSLAKAFEENGQLMPNHKGGVCYPVLQFSLHHQLNEVFQLPHLVCIGCASKAI